MAVKTSRRKQRPRGSHVHETVFRGINVEEWLNRSDSIDPRFTLVRGDGISRDPKPCDDWTTSRWPVSAHNAEAIVQWLDSLTTGNPSPIALISQLKASNPSRFKTFAKRLLHDASWAVTELAQSKGWQLPPAKPASDLSLAELKHQLRQIRAWIIDSTDRTPKILGIGSTIFSLGSGKYRFGQAAAVKVTDTEDTVLQAMLELGGVASKDELCDRSGKADAPRVLTSLRKKYVEVASLITLPGKKGTGGYRVRISKPASLPPPS